MSAPPLPSNESARLACLRDYRVLDTAPEEAFDRVTRLAAGILGVPISLVSLVDADRQWFKSRVGLDATETPRDFAFCAHAICDHEVMEVPDARRDDRFCDNPLVTGAPHIRFYAGAPLETADGHRLGTLCAIDTEPRQLDSDQKQQLHDLASIVIDELELRHLAERSRQAEARLTDAVEALDDGFVLYDAEDRLTICNARYREIYAESADIMREGATFAEMLPIGVYRGQYPEAIGREEEWIANRLHAHFNPGEPFVQELPGNRWMRIVERRTRDGGLVGFRVDVTELKRAQQKLAELAWTDELTGLLNRRRFLELAGSECRRMAREGTRVAVLAIDIDHFKQVNDRHGHAGGDAVLQDLAATWREVLREHDLIGRLGGEEFAVLMPLTREDMIDNIANRLRVATSATMVIHEGERIRATASIGYAHANPAIADIDALLAQADAALYEAKRGGRDRCVAAAA
ncbi:MAG: diguanylate cyclase [Alphaproteobacteria bacterium]